MSDEDTSLTEDIESQECTIGEIILANSAHESAGVLIALCWRGTNDIAGYLRGPSGSQLRDLKFYPAFGGRGARMVNK